MRCSIIALTALLISPVFSQANPDEPINAALCELVSEPEVFNNKLVEIRSEFVSRFQWEGLVDENCSAKILVGAHHAYDGLTPERGQFAFTSLDDDYTHPERLTWRRIEPRLRVDLKQDDNYRAFQKYTAMKFKWPVGGVCLDCPSYRIVLTSVGRFDYFPTQTVAVRANPATKAIGYAAGDNPNSPLLRLILQSVSDVTASPINPSTYSGKRRDVTLEEAYGLVKAFQKDHREGGSLEKYEVTAYPGFEFFQALPDPASGRLHYPVDLRTADVWDEGSCEKLTSPSLKKLQIAIRSRIGLTADEYRKIVRPGPFCER